MATKTKHQKKKSTEFTFVKTCQSMVKIDLAPGGVRTRDLRITSASSATAASTAYKYDALTDCATGAGCCDYGSFGAKTLAKTPFCTSHTCLV